jgi:hypothetical protein
MKRQLSLQTTVVIGLFMLLSFIAINSAFAQDAPYSEEFMQQHDGGDRVEYLQEMSHSDPSFYAPPTN